MIDVSRDLKLAVVSPTLEALDRQVAELLVEADATAPVKAAAETAAAALAELEKLTTRQTELNGKGVALHRRLAEHRQLFKSALIANEPLTDAALQAHGNCKVEAEGVGSALELLVVDLIPAARRNLVIADVAFRRAQGAAILEIAQSRANRIAEQLADIASANGAVEIELGRVPLIAMLLTERDKCLELARQGAAHIESTKKG